MATVTSSFLPIDQPLRRRVPRPSPTAPNRWRNRQEPQLQSHKRCSKYDQATGRSIRVSRLDDNRIVRQRRSRSSYLAWGFDDVDNRRLAADPSFALPSDFSRCKPRLERQDLVIRQLRAAGAKDRPDRLLTLVHRASIPIKRSVEQPVRGAGRR